MLIRTLLFVFVLLFGFAVHAIPSQITYIFGEVIHESPPSSEPEACPEIDDPSACEIREEVNGCAANVQIIEGISCGYECCASVSDMRYCDTNKNGCVECLVDVHCTDPDKPVCDNGFCSTCVEGSANWNAITKTCDCTNTKDPDTWETRCCYADEEPVYGISQKQFCCPSLSEMTQTDAYYYDESSKQCIKKGYCPGHDGIVFIVDTSASMASKKNQIKAAIVAAGPLLEKMNVGVYTAGGDSAPKVILSYGLHKTAEFSAMSMSENTHAQLTPALRRVYNDTYARGKYPIFAVLGDGDFKDSTTTIRNQTSAYVAACPDVMRVHGFAFDAKQSHIKAAVEGGQGEYHIISASTINDLVSSLVFDLTTCVPNQTGTICAPVQEENACQDGLFSSETNVCSECSSTQTPVTSKSECDICADARFWRHYDRICYLCTVGQMSYTEKLECDRCPGRFWYAGLDNVGYCALCTDGSRVTSESDCLDACGGNARFHVSTTNYCYKCENTSAYANTTEKSCANCPNRYWYLTAGKETGTCAICSENSRKGPSSDECLTICNGTWFYRSYDGMCLNCDYTTAITNTTRSECLNCPNRYWQVTNATKELGTCSFCPTGKTVSVDGLMCS